MTENEVLVYVDIRGQPVHVGRLWTHIRRGPESATFTYEEKWLDDPEHFALEPALALGRGPIHTREGQSLPGAIGDSAPDRWGRMLMQRAERHRAKLEGEAPRTLHEIHYLLGVNDEARPGALRFAINEGGPFLADRSLNRVPPLVELPQLLSAAERVAEDAETQEDLRLLLAPGASLGGARPKASVLDKNGLLAIAKFPREDDDFDAVLWEALALTLASKAGIQVPNWRLEYVGEKRVLISQRFDRSPGERIPFLSAMSMLTASENERRSYLEFADALRSHGAAPNEDMQSLWRRIVFNVLISNTDNHLRNHGFLYEGPKGWRLSPAYDLNPVPITLRARVLETSIELDDNSASLALALGVADHFELSDDDARAIASEVGNSLVAWRDEASRLGIPKRQIDRMESAFEHEDLAASLKLS